MVVRNAGISGSVKVSYTTKQISALPGEDYIEDSGGWYKTQSFFLKGLGTFCTTQNTNVHRLTLNLHDLKIMIVESFLSNITC